MQQQPVAALKSKMFASCPHHRPNARGGGDSAPRSHSGIQADGGREVGEEHRVHHTLTHQAPAQEKPTPLLLMLSLPNTAPRDPHLQLQRGEGSTAPPWVPGGNAAVLMISPKATSQVYPGHSPGGCYWSIARHSFPELMVTTNLKESIALCMFYR